MRYSFNILKNYLSDEISREEFFRYIDILGLNPVFIEKNDDVIFELETPANRADLLSLIGIVRELFPFLPENIRIQLPEIKFYEEIEEVKNVKIEDINDCSYYSCRIVRNIKKINTPEDFRKNLEKLGFKSSFLPVDISNFVMAETGQPIHIFDLDTLEDEIIVRRAKEGEKIICLDGNEYTLSPDVLVIADSKKPIAIAGIIGGLNSCVTQKTKNILIESALFNPVAVRRASKKLGITTEASLRFEKGLSTETTIFGMERTTYLIKQLCGGQIGKLSYSGQREISPVTIKLRKERIDKIIGSEIADDFIEKLFTKLNFEFKKEKNIFIVEVPFHRKDLKEEIDLIEEIAKYSNYSTLKETTPTADIIPTPSDKYYEKIERVKDLLVKLGFYEVITLSIISEEITKIYPDFEIIRIENPLSVQLNCLRPALHPQMLEVMRYNVNHQIKEGKFFELGKVYKKENGKFKEELHLSLGIINSGDFYDLKGFVEYILKQCNIKDVNFSIDTNPISQKNGTQVIFYKEKKIGEILIPKKEILEKFEIEKERVFLAEVNLETLLADISFIKRFVPLPKFPFSKRDFSFLLPNNINWQEIESEILALNLPVESIHVFDIYRGKNIPSDKISISFSIYFRCKEKTLTAEEVEEYSKKIISKIEEKFKGSLRGAKI